MDACALKSAERLVPPSYVSQGQEALGARQAKIRLLLEQRKCPKQGWDDLTIELILNDLAAMDSNNFSHNCGVGEREGRVYSDLVAKRHFRLAHGLGRSGDLAETQPKAAGSSILYKLTNAMMLDLIRQIGVQKTAACLVIPMATGMTLTLCLLTLRHSRPQAKFVLWPRIDQKSCFKSITTAGYSPEIIENILEGEELRSDVEEMERRVKHLGADNIAAVLTTTSCFAPRGIDKLEEIGQLCAKYNIPHIINNAYGLQSSKCLHHIQQASRLGRVDAFVQSTDKNLMVPVGGSVVAGFDAAFVAEIGKTYPGRASSSPILDAFITLLSLGTEGYAKLMVEQKTLKAELTESLRRIAEKHGLRIIEARSNPISVALTLPLGCEGNELTQLGSMLFRRGVSGTRVVTAMDVKTIAGHKFVGWGSHTTSYPHPYLTAAAAIGMSKHDINLFTERLEKCLIKFLKQRANNLGKKVEEKQEEMKMQEDYASQEKTAKKQEGSLDE